MYCQIDGVNNPPQHCLDGAPRAVPLAKLLQQHGLLPVDVITVLQGPQHIVDGLEQDPANSLAIPAPLVESEEIIHKHVNVPQRPGLRRERRVALRRDGQ